MHCHHSQLVPVREYAVDISLVVREEVGRDEILPTHHGRNGTGTTALGEYQTHEEPQEGEMRDFESR